MKQPEEQFEDLKGWAAVEKFEQLICKKSGAECAEDASEFWWQRLREQYPALAKNHDDERADFERKRLDRIKRYPG